MKNLELKIESKFSNTQSICELHFSNQARWALLGAERSGRRPFFRLMAGIKNDSRWELSFDGQKILFHKENENWEDPFPHELRKKIGVQSENDGLLSNVSVLEGLQIQSHLSAKEIQESEWLSALHLEKQILFRPVELTSSERRLTALLRLFLRKPQLLLLEDPTRPLAVGARALFENALTKYLHQEEKASLILLTDEPKIAEKFANHWIYFQSGLPCFQGSPETFWNSNNLMLHDFKGGFAA